MSFRVRADEKNTFWATMVMDMKNQFAWWAQILWLRQCGIEIDTCLSENAAPVNLWRDVFVLAAPGAWLWDTQELTWNWRDLNQAVFWQHQISPLILCEWFSDIISPEQINQARFQNESWKKASYESQLAKPRSHCNLLTTTTTTTTIATTTVTTTTTISTFTNTATTTAATTIITIAITTAITIITTSTTTICTTSNIITTTVATAVLLLLLLLDLV